MFTGLDNYMFSFMPGEEPGQLFGQNKKKGKGFILNKIIYAISFLSSNFTL